MADSQDRYCVRHVILDDGVNILPESPIRRLFGVVRNDSPGISLEEVETRPYLEVSCLDHSGTEFTVISALTRWLSAGTDPGCSGVPCV